ARGSDHTERSAWKASYDNFPTLIFNIRVDIMEDGRERKCLLQKMIIHHVKFGRMRELRGWSNLKTQEQREFEKFLERIEDPNNHEGINYDLPENPTSLQVAKYKLCKKILAYQIGNNLTDKEIAARINLSIAETEDILFCCIEKFTLDRLLTYASQLLSPAEVNVSVEQKEPAIHARV
ncbi:26684_t:CDS:2, partial [Racocetra persica]